jgi:hypothetical protein
MMSEQQRKECLVVLFVVGALALTYPLLSLVDWLLLPLGIPMLYLYIFVVWLVIIALMARLVEGSESRTNGRAEP